MPCDTVLRAWYSVASYRHSREQISRTYLSCIAYTLDPLNSYSLSQRNQHSTFCLSVLGYFVCLVLSGIMQYLSVCVWLGSLHVMSPLQVHPHCLLRVGFASFYG